MTRVLHYGLSTNTGGIETYLLDLTRTIDRSRFQFGFTHVRDGVPCYRNELSALGAEFFPVTPRRTSLRRNKSDLDELFRRGGFDILHCHMNTLSYVEPIRAALRHDCRVLIHSHNSGAKRSFVTNALHWFHFLTLPRKRVRMIAVSRLAGEWLFGKFADFTVVNNGIDVDKFRFNEVARHELRQRLQLEDRIVVGSVAAFLPAKNHPFLLRVFKAVLQQRPDAVLLLVGGGHLEDSVRELTVELEIAESVRFLGRRGDVPAILSAMDVLLLPSLFEGFPLAVMEAQASGLPCILSDAITDEVVLSGSCHRLPLSWTPEAWAERLLEARPADRSTAADGLAGSRHSLEGSVRAIEETYERMLSGSVAH